MQCSYTPSSANLFLLKLRINREKESVLYLIMSQIQPFTKEQYQRTLRDRRISFIETYFADSVNTVFNTLRESANQDEPIHHTFEFTIPRNLDVDNTEQTLRTYFADYNYNTIPEPRKDNKQRVISITLT